MPALVDHGPQPAASACARIGSAVSWCQATSQLAEADLSNSVARNGCALPTKRAARSISRGSPASARISGSARTWRAPARLRVVEMAV